MLPGAPKEARWMQSEPRRSMPAAVVERMLHTAFPRCRVVEMQPLDGGLRNANFRLRLDSPSNELVLRVYEHDASICQKEVDLLRLVAGAVPVPEVIYAAPNGLDELPPFALLRFVAGISFRDLKHSEDAEAIAQAARSAGETLAAIGRFKFPKAGWLAPGPSVGPPLLAGADANPRFVDLCLTATTLQARVPADLRETTHNLVWLAARELAQLDQESRLVHGDFNKRNLLVHCIEGKWSVAAVVDWEFAISGTPLCDVANFLRYECAARPIAEPHFSDGFLQAGGTLPHDWRRLARILDLTAVCESLTHDELPGDVAAELLETVRATVENRDLQLP